MVAPALAWAQSDFTKSPRWPLVSDKQAKPWVVDLGVRERLQGRRGYDSNILLKNRIKANGLLFCLLCLILRFGEGRVSMPNTKGDAPEKD